MDGMTDVEQVVSELNDEIMALRDKDKLTAAEKKRRKELVGMMKETGYQYREIANIFKMKFKDVINA